MPGLIDAHCHLSFDDAGSNPDATGHSSAGPLQAEYEASDPVVVGVGGTSLTLTAGGRVTAETAWAGSGGGRSILFPRASWQQGTGVPAGTERLVPDVSLAADPNKGALPLKPLPARVLGHSPCRRNVGHQM